MINDQIDPITFEVVRNGLDSMVDEMAITVMRTAYSGVVRDALDYSTAFCAADGQVIAQGLTIMLHLGSFPAAINSVLTKFDNRIKPGDVFILNDPYTSGGIHLPDVYIIKPIFATDSLRGFVGVVAHQADIGGLVPGSNSTESTEIYQEGLRIPTSKLYDAGEPNEAVFDFIATNVRLPIQVRGDMRSQLAACDIGERAVLELIERYGADNLTEYFNNLLDYSEQRARSEIKALPDGTFRFEDFIDADNIKEGPVRIAVKIKIEGDEIFVDLSGSSPQVPAGINSPIPFTRAAIYGAIRLIMDPDIPNAAGYHRPIHINVPEGTVVNPVHPAPVAARGITGFRTMDAVLGALAQAMPDRVPADGEGGNTLISIGGTRSDGSPYALVDFFGGARGGGPKSDGSEGVSHPASNLAGSPVEILEVENPIVVDEYALIQDSGGAGKFRGAQSYVKQITNIGEKATLQLRSDKRKFPPYGLQGGSSGSPSMNILNPGHEEKILPTLAQVELPSNGVIRHKMAGGGGWGNPIERDPSRVLDDVIDDRVSIQAAKSKYGVVISEGENKIDRNATKILRSKMQKQTELQQ
ncbi:MAG: hydantoinase B/oxoprolinase family protein [Dehalococcoidia bacterium]|nr:hydantoinase B/oxoprolinase family protein [Dehalococcoidia bacterium]